MTSSGLLSEDCCVALGCSKETGKCNRHPTVAVIDVDAIQQANTTSTTTTSTTTTSSSHNHIITQCRICHSELALRGRYQQRKSMAPNIRQIQQLRHDFDQRANWGTMMEEHTHANEDTNTNEHQEEDDHQQEQIREHENDKGENPNAIITADSSSLFCRFKDVIQQAVTRTTQVQEWSILEKDQELERLQHQVQQLESLLDVKKGQIVQLQNTVDKQQKTISQELRMIKSIAKKRAATATATASAAASAGGVASGNSSASPSASPNTSSTGIIKSKRRASNASTNTTTSSVGEDKILQEEYYGTDDMVVTASMLQETEDAPKLPGRKSSQSRGSIPKLPIRLPSSSSDSINEEDNQPHPPTHTTMTMMSRRKVSLNSPENETPPLLPQRQTSNDVSSAYSFQSDAVAVVTTTPPPPPENDNDDDQEEEEDDDDDRFEYGEEEESLDTGNAKVFYGEGTPDSAYSSWTQGTAGAKSASTSASIPPFSTTVSTLSQNTLATTDTTSFPMNNNNLSTSPRYLSMHRVQERVNEHDDTNYPNDDDDDDINGGATRTTFGSEFTLETDTDHVVSKTVASALASSLIPLPQRKLSARPDPSDKDGNGNEDEDGLNPSSSLQRHLSRVSNESLQPEDLFHTRDITSSSTTSTNHNENDDDYSSSSASLNEDAKEKDTLSDIMLAGETVGQNCKVRSSHTRPSHPLPGAKDAAQRRSQSQEISFVPTLLEQEEKEEEGNDSTTQTPIAFLGSQSYSTQRSQPKEETTSEEHASTQGRYRGSSTSSTKNKRKQRLEEIEFDASAAFGQWNNSGGTASHSGGDDVVVVVSGGGDNLERGHRGKQHSNSSSDDNNDYAGSELRTSVAHARFDASQQLLLEASQALTTGTMPTPSSVKLRKSLTKSIRKHAATAAVAVPPPPPSEQAKSPRPSRRISSNKKNNASGEIVLSPAVNSNSKKKSIRKSVPNTEIVFSPKDASNRKSTRSSDTSLRKVRSSFQGPAPPPTSAATSTATASANQEIEFSLAATVAEESSVMSAKASKPKRSLLERHLAPSLRNLGESMHNKTEEEILQERVYGNAAVATQEDEDDDEYDDFDAGLDHLPFVNQKGYLEYNRSFNLSPVSALTTGSYLKDGGGDPSDDDEDEIGPRKALHNAGFVKRLPLEDGFESGEDETTVPQPEDESNVVPFSEEDDDEEEEDEDDQGMYEEEESLKGDSPPPPPNLNDAGAHNNMMSNHSSQASDLELSHGSMNASQQSFQSDSVLSPVPIRPKSSRQQPSKMNKPVLRVDGETVKDKYGDAGTYTGTISQDERLPHGYGQMKYDNERQYDGEWKGGRWHGYGRWVNPNGDCYEGTFVYDARQGNGVYTWKNGNVYRGEFYEDKRQGKGTFHFANGNIYEGDFLNGVFEGEGKYKFDGGFFEGQWKKGRYHGNGLLLFADGSSYQGEFLNGVAHGKGEERSVKGTVRKGIWENGRPQAAR